MRKRMMKKMIKKEIMKVVKEYKNELIVMGDRDERLLMYYSEKENKIGFNRNGMKKYYQENIEQEGILFSDFIKTCTMHELGHHKDEKLSLRNEEKKKIEDKMWSILNGRGKSRDRSVKERFEDIIPYQLDRDGVIVGTEKEAWKLAYKINQKEKIVSEEVFLKLESLLLESYLRQLRYSLERYEDWKAKSVECV